MELALAIVYIDIKTKENFPNFGRINIILLCILYFTFRIAVLMINYKTCMNKILMHLGLPSTCYFQ